MNDHYCWNETEYECTCQQEKKRPRQKTRGREKSEAQRKMFPKMYCIKINANRKVKIDKMLGKKLASVT